jgi:hypothetical protein
MKIAPIVLFVYNRPAHTQKVIESLKNNLLAAKSDLIIFSDGPKNEQAVQTVKAVRKYLREINGFNSIRIVENDSNQGLAHSIIKGVSDVVNRYGNIIVLEDDILTSPFFLDYMNEGLEIYKDDEDVISIHGYMYPHKEDLPDTFFIKGADCWGWATWKRGWDLFDSDANKLLFQLRERKLTKQFDFNGAYPFTKMLEYQGKGKIDSWAIRWNAVAFLNDKLTLYPGKSLVHNIGNDGSGTHAGNYKFLDVKLDSVKIHLNRIPATEDMIARKVIEKSLRQSNPKRIRNLFKRVLNNIFDEKR